MIGVLLKDLGEVFGVILGLLAYVARGNVGQIVGACSLTSTLSHHCRFPLCLLIRSFVQPAGSSLQR
jgi:hypothetical protein